MSTSALNCTVWLVSILSNECEMSSDLINNCSAAIVMSVAIKKAPYKGMDDGANVFWESQYNCQSIYCFFSHFDGYALGTAEAVCRQWDSPIPNALTSTLLAENHPKCWYRPPRSAVSTLLFDLRLCVQPNRCFLISVVVFYVGLVKCYVFFQAWVLWVCLVPTKSWHYITLPRVSAY